MEQLEYVLPNYLLPSASRPSASLSVKYGIIWGQRATVYVVAFLKKTSLLSQRGGQQFWKRQGAGGVLN
jgi:hypothetical protein